MEFTVGRKIKLYAYGGTYRDGGGSSGKRAIIYKWDSTQNKYVEHTRVSTNDSGNRYELVTLTPGKYKMTRETCCPTFDEFEYELVN